MKVFRNMKIIASNLILNFNSNSTFTITCKKGK